MNVTIETTGSPIAGNSNYMLTCSVSGTRAPATYTYEWFGPINGTSAMISVGSLHQFSALLASHAGEYTCRACDDSEKSVVGENRITLSVNSEYSND